MSPGSGAADNEVARSAIESIVALAAATALVAFLELPLGMENASSVYLLAVAALAIRRGTIPAILTAIGAFLIYNLLFVEPRITFGVASPEQLLNLLLLLFVGIVIGRLAGRQRDREQLALSREREARALFSISRELATAHRVDAALPIVLARLVVETQLERAWIGIGPTIAQERTIADSATGKPIPFERLDALPHARFCIEAKEKEEDAKRR